jgi:hypothetical protein
MKIHHEEFDYNIMLFVTFTDGKKNKRLINKLTKAGFTLGNVHTSRIDADTITYCLTIWNSDARLKPAKDMLMMLKLSAEEYTTKRISLEDAAQEIKDLI